MVNGSVCFLGDGYRYLTRIPSNRRNLLWRTDGMEIPGDVLVCGCDYSHRLSTPWD